MRIAAVAAATAIFLAGCAAPDPAGSTDSPDAAPEKVTFAVLPAIMVNFPLWVAQDQGYFEEEGVDAEVVTISGGGAQLVAALTAGSADLTYMTPEQMAQSNRSGKVVQYVVGNYNKQPFALMVKKDLPEPSATDSFETVMHSLRGKSIAITTIGSGSYHELITMLELAGMTESDVQILQSGTSPVAAFSHGEYDAILQTEPVISQLTVGQELARIVIDLRAESGNAPKALTQRIYSGWVARADIATDTRIYQASKALQRAIEYIRDGDNLDNLVRIAVENLGQDASQIELITNQVKSEIAAFESTISSEQFYATLEGNNLTGELNYEDSVVGVAAGN